MNRCKRVVMGLTMLSLAGFMTACATIQPSDTVRAQVRDAVVAAETGATVHLYYGMDKTAKEEFCVGAEVPVYRLGGGGIGQSYTGKTEVGKVKVTKDLGDHYVEAEVVEGSLRAGDIAMLAHSECLLNIPSKTSPE